MATVTCRLARPADIPRIVDLVNRAFVVERFLFDGDRTHERDVRASFARGAFLIAERDDLPIASVYVEIRGDRGYVGMLAVDPAAQGGGAGRAIMEAAEQHCRQAGCRAIDLSVLDQRPELPAFYRRLGYVEHGTAPYSGTEPRA